MIFLMGERNYNDAPTQCHIIAPYPAQCNRTINPHWEIIPVFIFISVFSVSFQKRIQNGHSIWFSLYFTSVTSKVKPQDPEPMIQIVRTSILGQISAFLNLLSGTFVCWCASSQQRTFSKLIFVRSIGLKPSFSLASLR